MVRLEERLEEHSQLSKARALFQLRLQLCHSGFGGNGVNPDLDWSILSLLFSLASRPLDTVHPIPLQPQQQQQHPSSAFALAPGANLATFLSESEAASPRGSELDPWDAASDLSDWSHDPSTLDADEGVGQDPSSMQWETSAVSSLGEGAPQTGNGWQSGGTSLGSRGAVNERFPADADGSVWLQLAEILSAPRASGSSRKPVPPPAVAACSLPGDLIPSLARARFGAPLPMLHSGWGKLLRPEDCRRDADLLHQALALMMGTRPTLTVQPYSSSPSAAAPTPGLRNDGRSASRLDPVFIWDEAIPGPVARSGVHVPYLSQTQLEQVLAKVAVTGGMMHRLRLVSDIPASQSTLEVPIGMTNQPNLRRHTPAAAATPEGTPTLVRPTVVLVTPTIRAFLTALSQQVLRLTGPLVALQQQNLKELLSSSERPSPGSSCWMGGQTMTLLGLLEATASVARRVAFLHDICSEVLTSLPSSNGETATATAEGWDATASEAAASCSLLDRLHSRLRRLAPLGGPEARSQQQVLMHLFMCALVPTLEGIQSWLSNGESVLPTDFFIRPSERCGECLR